MRTAALALLAGTALVLAGCTPVATPPSRTPEPSATPAFASDEEALAAAEKAYERYLAISDEVVADGGADPGRLKNYVTPEWYERELKSASRVAAAGVHQVGSSEHSPLQLQQMTIMRKTLTAYTCLDLSKVRILDASGLDVTPTRSGDTPVEVSLQFDAAKHRYLVSSNEPWSGLNFCS